MAETVSTKQWYHSKTLWVNALTVTWQLVAKSLDLPTLDDELLVGLLGIVNLVLRIVTKEGLSTDGADVAKKPSA